MWPDRVSNPGPLTYESGALPTALRGPAFMMDQGYSKHRQLNVAVFKYSLCCTILIKSLSVIFLLKKFRGAFAVQTYPRILGLIKVLKQNLSIILMLFVSACVGKSLYGYCVVLSFIVTFKSKHKWLNYIDLSIICLIFCGSFQLDPDCFPRPCKIDKFASHNRYPNI